MSDIKTLLVRLHQGFPMDAFIEKIKSYGISDIIKKSETEVQLGVYFLKAHLFKDLLEVKEYFEPNKEVAAPYPVEVVQPAIVNFVHYTTSTGSGGPNINQF